MSLFFETTYKRKSVVTGGARTHTCCSPGEHPNHLDHQHTTGFSL